MQLELSDHERRLLLRMLESALGDLRVEVRRTRTPSFHDELASEEETLKSLIERLRGP